MAHLFLISSIEVSGQVHAPAALPWERTPVLIDSRLDGPRPGLEILEKIINDTHKNSCF